MVGWQDSADSAVIDWLLAGDVSVQYQTCRDLLHEDRPDLRAQIAKKGRGARFLVACNADGSWGRGSVIIAVFDHVLKN